MTDTPVKQSNAQRKHALVVYIMELFSQIDELATLKKAGHSARLSSYMFEETCSVLKDLDDDTLEEYFDILVTLGSARNVAKLPPVLDDDYLEAITDKRKELVTDLRGKLVA